MQKNKAKSVRLSSNVSPSRYRLMIHPSHNHKTFKGEETIELALAKPTKAITLHSADLTISSVFLSQKKSRQEGIVSYDPAEETATFTFAKAVQGKCELELAFNGKITEKLAGFYRSTYEHEGEKRTLATTQFEPVDARRAFPCFDEPSQKAIFDITLMVPKGQIAISNTYEIDREIETPLLRGGAGEGLYEIVKFAPTPRMSTYLVAFIVGNFDYVEAKTKGGVRVRIFATPGKKHQSEYALDTTVKILEFYTDYFGIKYPLPVLDLIAVPDFPVGAMENWGAITYRETGLLVDPDHSSAAAKQRVTLVIAHELAHQWFGNLVTMEWWTQLWLNEGFASWIEFLAMNHIHPEWNMWEQFHTMDKAEALHLDALASTHPIEVPVHHPKEISSLFDAVSYHKGASVIHMLHAFLGPKTFQKGLQHYLKKHSYKNTVTKDLWDSLTKVSGVNVAKLMTNWIGEPGYPIVSASLKSDKIVLSQERFFSNPKSATKKNAVWQIPVLIEQAGKKQLEKTLLTKKQAQVLVGASADWTLVNAGQAGFFRTAYSKELLAKLYEPIRNKELSPIDRLSILSDAFASTRACRISTYTVLDLLAAYEHEDNYNVWSEIAGVIGAVDLMLHGNPLQKKLRAYARNLFATVMDTLGYQPKKDDSHSTSLLRSLTFGQLGRYGHTATVEHAEKLFDAHVASGAEIYPDLRAGVYQTVALHGNVKEYEQMLALWHKESMQEEKQRLAIALGFFRDSALALRTLDFSMSDMVRPQDSRTVQAGVIANPEASEVLWRWTEKNWGLLYDRFSHTGSLFNFMALGFFGHFQTKEQVKAAKLFWNKNKNKQKGAERPFAQAIESVEGRLLWHKKAQKDVEKFLKNL
ncbi:MAG: M1 family metallopeptidase [Candidatus Paceibacterota bacterium]|jgi:puromycin-sensitive aminopeptidase